MVLFGELTSESPRMPSPWSTRQLSSSPASNSNGTPVNDSPLLSTSLPPHARQRSSRLSSEARNSSNGSGGGGGGAARPVSADEDDDDDDDDEQGFFSLDLDLDRVSNALATPSASLAAAASATTDANAAAAADPPPARRSSDATQLTSLAPELDARGNLEYKLIVRPATRLRFQSLVTQCQWRIVQGGGVATYEVGVLDCGALVGLSRLDMRESLANLSSMAKQLDATLCIRRVIVLESMSGALKQDLKIRPDDTDLSEAVRRAKIKSRAARASQPVVNDDDEASETTIRALDEEQARTLLGAGELDALPDAWTYDVCAVAASPPAQPDAGQPMPDFQALNAAAMESDEEEDDDDNDDQGFGFSLSLDDYAPPVCKPAAVRPAATQSSSPARSATPRTPPFMPSLRTPAASGDSSVSSSSSSYASSSSACSTSSGAPPTIRLDEPRDEKACAATSLSAELDVLSFAPRSHADKASKAEAARLKAHQQSQNKITARAKAALDRRERRLAQLRAAELAGAGWAPELPADVQSDVQEEQQEPTEEAEENDDEESLSFLAQFSGSFDDDDEDDSDEWAPVSRSLDGTEEHKQLGHRNEAKKRRREVRRMARQAAQAEQESQQQLAHFVQQVYSSVPDDKVYSASMPVQHIPSADALSNEARIAAMQKAAQALLKRQAAHTRSLEAQLGLQPDTRIIVEAQVLSRLAKQQAYFANFANAPS